MTPHLSLFKDQSLKSSCGHLNELNCSHTDRVLKYYVHGATAFAETRCAQVASVASATAPSFTCTSSQSPAGQLSAEGLMKTGFH